VRYSTVNDPCAAPITECHVDVANRTAGSTTKTNEFDKRMQTCRPHSARTTSIFRRKIGNFFRHLRKAII